MGGDLRPGISRTVLVGHSRRMDPFVTFQGSSSASTANMCPKLQSGQLVDREMADAGTLRPVAKGLTAGRLNGRFGLMAQGRREDGEGHVEERPQWPRDSDLSFACSLLRKSEW